MASRPSYRPGEPKLSRYGISKAPSSVNISAAFFGSRNDPAVNSSSSSFAFFMCDPFCHGDAVSALGVYDVLFCKEGAVVDRVGVRVDPLGHSAIPARARSHPQCASYPLGCRSKLARFALLMGTRRRIMYVHVSTWL